MEDDDDAAWEEQDDVHGQVGGAGLQCFAVQSLVLTTQTHHGDLQIGEHYAAKGAGHHDYGSAKAIDVVDENTFTRQLEQGGIVTEWVDYQAPAAWQADAEAHEDYNQKESCPPGRHRQLHHHPVGHDGGVTQRVADGHVPIKSHDNEYSVSSACMKVSTKSLNDTVNIMNVPLCHWSKNITQQARNNGRGPERIINTHVAEEQIHGLVEAPLHQDQDHQADVGHHDEDVDEEEEEEGRNRGLRADL